MTGQLEKTEVCLVGGPKFLLQDLQDFLDHVSPGQVMNPVSSVEMFTGV